MDNLKSQGIKAFLWDFSGKFAQFGMSFFVSIILARLLEPSEFGLMAMVAVIVAITQIFTDGGLGLALIQRRKVLPIHYVSVFYFGITLAALLGVVMFFSAKMISDFYANQQLIPLVELMSFSFLLGALSSVQSTMLRKDINYKLITKLQLIASFLSGVVGVSFALYGAGVWSLVLQHLSHGIVYNVLIWNMVHWRPSLSFSFKALVQLWGYGFRMFLSTLLESVFSRLDYMIIGRLYMPSILGYVQRAKSLNLLLTGFSADSLMSVLFPLLSKVQTDLQRFQRIVLKALSVVSFMTFLLIAILFINSEEIIIILFGEQWLPSAHYFKILTLSGFAYPVSALLVNILSSRGNSKAFLRLEIYKKMITSMNLVILYFFGIETFLYGLIVESTLNVFLNVFFASRELKLSPIKIARPILTQAVIAFVAINGTAVILQHVSTVDIVNLVSKIFCVTILYFVTNIVLRTESFSIIVNEVRVLIRKYVNAG